ncbi:penicillin acylase family protein [Glaciecola sp. KUL10]|uniref:penicillin acylase family protein n=1 Tax=Glaciecola sp. (strain KUL10) TaxID=2161813 RepID=UPI000D78552F|nr:penicillin acylase family protein [Glaciecola sp. KUL10]GBL03094.1 penicillin amidase [Glaciecola sp. KUL10]
MIKLIKWLLLSLIAILMVLFLYAWYQLSASLPNLEGTRSSDKLSAVATLERDSIGTAIVKADNQKDAAFLLGYAHGQDRFFQMDTLRRSAAGELSELFGGVTLNIDKKARFHQFRKRAERIFKQLPSSEQIVLKQYSAGVNKALAEMKQIPFEYLLTQSTPQPWKPEESLLVSYSMYLDLQGSQVERDMTLTVIRDLYGEQMLEFFHLPSAYQASLDGSVIKKTDTEIPTLVKDDISANSLKNLELANLFDFDSIQEPLDLGSNNWAVTGALTDSASAMLSNDMHLSLRVPPIWYRAQLNYKHNDQQIKITGVSLPGTPTIIVGSNGKIAWGFTNANLDNVEWIELADTEETSLITETIKIKDDIYDYRFEMSQYGPIERVNNKNYALAWVAHKDYGANMMIAHMAHQETVEEALVLSTKAGMPVQNMMVVDSKGNAAWKPTGAVTARPSPSNSAIQPRDYSPLWAEQEQNVPVFINPKHGRLWTANNRIISVDDLPRFGNGGYALGARGIQIRDRLFDLNQFGEKDFYDILLDNEARFLMSWHSLLLSQLSKMPTLYQTDIKLLENWKACACSDSIGYSLVRRYRSTVINQLVQPIEQTLKAKGRSIGPILREIETAIWLVLNEEEPSWLPDGHKNYDDFLITAYNTTKEKLIEKHGADPTTLSGLEWGKVNELRVEHPIAASVGPLARFLNMRPVEGFGDSYLPAVQGNGFGASQRLIVRPGNEDNAILTVPGGQSGHPLSEFYDKGFMAYANGENTPLLPNQAIYRIKFSPK